MATFKHVNYKDDDGYEHVVDVSTTWDLIAQKPETYPPSAHTHDDRYYTEAEMDAALTLKQDAATAITTGNIASQSVNYAAGAGNANNDQSGNNIKATYAADLTISDHTISLKNKNGGEIANVTIPDNNTWKANSASSEGYVASAAGQANKVWKTDANGNPAWRNDTNTDTTYSLSTGDSNGQIKVTPSNGSSYNVSVRGLGSLAYSSATIPTNTNQLDNGAGYITGITKKMVTDALGYTPPMTDTNTWRPLGTTADTACAGNDSRLSNARPASDVYAWAKAASKPSYSWSEITNKPNIPSGDASFINPGSVLATEDFENMFSDNTEYTFSKSFSSNAFVCINGAAAPRYDGYIKIYINDVLIVDNITNNERTDDGCVYTSQMPSIIPLKAGQTIKIVYYKANIHIKAFAALT